MTSFQLSWILCICIFTFPVRVTWHFCAVETLIMYSLMPPSYVSTLPLISPRLPWYWTLKCCCNLTDEIMCYGCSTYSSKKSCHEVVDKLLIVIGFQFINEYMTGMSLYRFVTLSWWHHVRHVMTKLITSYITSLMTLRMSRDDFNDEVT